MNKILERLKITKETGKWWSIRWWQEDEYYLDAAFTRNQAETAFDELIKLFDAKWMLKQKIDNGNPPFAHPLANQLCTEGLHPFQILCSLGLDLYRARQDGLLTENLVRRLKNPKEYWESAVFELQLLSYLLSQGFRVEKEYKSGKGKRGNCNCDFKISKRDELVFIEAKRPEPMHRLNEEIYGKVFNRLMAFISESNSQAVSFVGAPLLPEPELKKIFRHLSYAVDYQLPSDGAGGVIIESHWLLDFWEKFKEMSDKRFLNKVKYGHLSFVVGTESFFSADKGFDHRVNILINHCANIDVSSYNILSALRIFSKN